MKKITLIASMLLAFSSFVANAEIIDKAIVNVKDGSEFTNPVGTLTKGNPFSIYNNNNGGRAFYYDWQEKPWTGVELPSTGYNFSYDLTFSGIGAAKTSLDFFTALYPVGVTPSLDSWNGLLFSSTDFIFKLQQTVALANNDMIKVGQPVTLCVNEGTTSNDTIQMLIGSKYHISIDVVGTNATYKITDNDATVVYESSRTLGSETRAGGYGINLGKYHTYTIGDMKLTYKYDGYVAYDPTVVLAEIAQNVEKD